MKLVQCSLFPGVSIIVLAIASTSADLIVQPGYEQSSPSVKSPTVNSPRHPRIVGSPQVMTSNNAEARSNCEQGPMMRNQEILYPGNAMVDPAYGQPSFRAADPRMNPPWEFPVGPTFRQSVGESMKCWLNCVPRSSLRPSTARQTALNAEIQRNQDLQRSLADQIYWMAPQTQPADFQRSATFRGRSPYYSRFIHRVITPSGVRGYNRKKYGWGRVPLYAKSSVNNQDCTDKLQYSRSVDDGRGVATEFDQIHAVASDPSLDKSNSSQVSDAPTNIESNGEIDKKIVEARQIGRFGDYMRIDQLGNPRFPNIITGMTSQIVNGAKSLGKTFVDTVSPIMGQRKYIVPRQNNNYNLGARPNESQDSKTDDEYQPPLNINLADSFPNVPQSDYRESYEPRQQAGNNRDPTDNSGGFNQAPTSFDPANFPPSLVSFSGMKNHPSNSFGLPRMNGYSMPFNPYALTNIIDQYGRPIFSSIPPTLNTMIANPNVYLSPPNLPVQRGPPGQRA